MPQCGSKSLPDGTVRLEYPGGGWTLSVPGMPGLKRTHKRPAWHIDKKIRGSRYQLTLPVDSLEAAKRLYAQFELDPDDFTRFLKQKYERPAWPVLIKEYESFMRVRKVGDRARKARLVALGDCLKDGGDLNTEAAIKAWLTPKNLANNTMVTYLAHLSAFLNWCLRRGYIKHNIIKEQSLMPRQDETKIERRRIISKEELERTLEWIGPPRFKMVLLVMWSMGLRVEEACSYERRHVVPDRMELFIPRSKGGKSRYIPIPDLTTLTALLELPKMRTAHFEAKTQKYLRETFDKHPEANRFTCHALRHSRITLWLAEGCWLYDVQKWAGHSRIEQTLAYLGECVSAKVMPRPTGFDNETIKMWSLEVEKEKAALRKLEQSTTSSETEKEKEWREDQDKRQVIWSWR